MAIYANASNQLASLKELYNDDSWVMKDMVYAKNPCFALLPKDEALDGMAGKYFPVPTIYGDPQGRSAVFGTAQTNQTATSMIEFSVYRVSNYQVVTISNELMEATASNIGAFIEASKLQLKTGYNNIGNDLARDCFSDGSGSRGTYGLAAGSISTGVITLDNRQQVVSFEVGQSLVSYSVSGSTPTQSTAAAVGYVIAVNRSAGTVTVAATQGGAAATPTNWSTSFPYLAVEGDVNFVSGGLLSANMRKIAGFGAWIPLTAPGGSDAFWGVNRSADVTRLAGQRFDGRGETIEEAIIDAASELAREDGMPDYCFMNFASYAALEKALGAKVTYMEVKHEEADIAFRGIVLHAPYGPITVLGDRWCPPQTAYLIQLDSWKLKSTGRAPHVLKYGSIEGLEGIRVSNADAVEIRIGYYANLVCNAPGRNGVIQLNQ